MFWFCPFALRNGKNRPSDFKHCMKSCNGEVKFW